MELSIKYQGKIQAHIKVSKAELKYNGFILNKSFIIEDVIVNGLSSNYSIELSDDHQYQIITISSGINAVNYMEVKYSGSLDGTTGLWPYVKEITLPEFALLRFETLCFPFFIKSIEDKELYSYVHSGFHLDSKITVSCNNHLTVFSNLPLENLATINNEKIFEFRGSFLNFVVGKFEQLKIPYGSINYLIGKEVKLDLKNIIDITIKYMSEYYGEVLIDDINIICIPEYLGSFVDKHTVFLALDALSDVRFIIHEIIHIGWNPLVELNAQRTRFFDEAITQYFTARIYDIFEENGSVKTYKTYQLHFKKTIKKHNISLVPLIDYGKYEYGDLSYSYGPLVLKAIEERIGVSNIDSVLRAMLAKYRYQEINFSKFFKLFDGYNINDIIEFYFYTTKGQNHILEN
jgi:hypothetical protein